MNEHLADLEKRSISIIREAKAQFKNLGVLWSTGKDSTAAVWLCKKAFFGKISFPVIHIDTSYKFPEIYEFRDKIAKARAREKDIIPDSRLVRLTSQNFS